jgi:hypothetical protein
MPTQLTLSLGDSKNIVVEFLENDFTAEFIPHLKAISDAYGFTSRAMYIPGLRMPWQPEQVKKHQQYIVDAVTQLNAMGLNFPVPVEDIVFNADDVQTRQLLNRLHRCFTTGNSTRNIWEYNTNHTFTLDPLDYQYFNDVVHRINTGVHNLENYTASDRLKAFPKYSEYVIEFVSQRPKNPDVQPTFFKFIKDEHFQYFSDQLEYDVWLPLTQIQGKDYWRGYFDYDDPRQWDISTNVVYSGSLALGDRTGAKFTVLEDWMRSYGIEPGPRQCGMPLGRITEGREYVSTLKPTEAIEDIIVQ